MTLLKDDDEERSVLVNDVSYLHLVRFQLVPHRLILWWNRLVDPALDLRDLQLVSIATGLRAWTAT